MTQSPVISGILTAPGRWASVGVVLNGERAGWGDCLISPGDAPFEAPPPSPEDIRAALSESVAPALRGRRLTAFGDVAATLDALTRTTRRPRPAAPAAEGRRISRRDLFTGRVGAEPPAQWVTEERPLHPGLRYGVSQALLAAAASLRGITPAEVIAAEYGLPLPDAPLPILAAYHGEWPDVAAVMPVGEIVAWGYTISAANFKAELGDECRLLQRNVRRLKEQLTRLTPAGYAPAIHLNLRGGLGRLYRNDPGKMLGALFGLERAAAPYRLQIADPVVTATLKSQIDLFNQLKEYARLRKLTLQLAAESGVTSADTAQAVLEAGAAELIRLNPPWMGSLHRAIEGVLACRERGGTVLLGSDRAFGGRAIRTACQVALATRPAAVIVEAAAGGDGEGVAAAQREMRRALAWIGARQEG
ncbi:MAG: hypothetical protein ACE5G8_00820 [Anaerolineae bacterium]